MTAVGQERSGSREEQQRERCSHPADGRAFGRTDHLLNRGCAVPSTLSGIPVGVSTGVLGFVT